MTEKRKIEALPAEVEKGNHEYKLQLANTSEERIRRLVSQMKWRLGEGGGEAKYSLGVEDDGKPTGISKSDLQKSVNTLKKMAKTLHCHVAKVETFPGLQANSRTALVTIRSNPVDKIPDEVRVIALGESSAGKTTLIGVLKTDEPDDGEGLARLQVLQHQHELDQGQTSSASSHNIWFDENKVADLEFDDQAVPEGIFTDQKRKASEKIQQYSKIVGLLDVAGHAKFIKSTFYGLMALQPDFALIAVDACKLLAADSERDFLEMLPVTLNILRMCRDLGLSFAFTVTQVDKVPDHTESESLFREKLALLFAAAGGGDTLPLDVPVFVTSSISMDGIGELRNFLQTVAPRVRQDVVDGSICMFVRVAFYILGFDGAVLGGIPISGTIRLGDTLKLGPDENGTFHFVSVESIRTAYGLSVSSISEGHTATLGVRLVRNHDGECDAFDVMHLGDNSSSSSVSSLSDVDSSDQEDTVESFLVASAEAERIDVPTKELGSLEKKSFATQQEFFRHVVRRGTCLLSAETRVQASKKVTVQVDDWLSFAPGNVCSLSSSFVPDIDKDYEFVIRSNTIKRRAKLVDAAPGTLTLQVLDDAEFFVDGTHVILQHTSIVAVATVCAPVSCCNELI